MDCQHAKPNLALWIGQDLADPLLTEQLRDHLQACSPCRQHAQALDESQGVLLAVAEQTPKLPEPKGWETMSRALPMVARSNLSTRWQRIWPASLMTAACLAIVAASVQTVVQQWPAEITPVATKFPATIDRNSPDPRAVQPVMHAVPKSKPRLPAHD